MPKFAITSDMRRVCRITWSYGKAHICGFFETRRDLVQCKRQGSNIHI